MGRDTSSGAKAPGAVDALSGINRTDIIQALLDKINGKRYLEIGVCVRSNFDKIMVKERIGVDPEYLFPNTVFFKLFRWCPLLYPCHKFLKKMAGERFFQMTSDRFFKENAQWLSQNPIDVCFIDGLHTYAQSLEDVVNCLKYLGPSGVIVLHDCCPGNATIAYPANSVEDAKKMNLPGWTGEWYGDVWKTIVFLRSQRNDLRVCVFNTDCGIGIVKRGEPESMLGYSKEEVDRMTYKDLDGLKGKLLNLKEPCYLNDLLKSL